MQNVRIIVSMLQQKSHISDIPILKSRLIYKTRMIVIFSLEIQKVTCRPTSYFIFRRYNQIFNSLSTAMLLRNPPSGNMYAEYSFNNIIESQGIIY